MKDKFIEAAHLIVTKNNVNYDLGYYPDEKKLAKMLNQLRNNNDIKSYSFTITYLTMLSNDKKLFK